MKVVEVIPSFVPVGGAERFVVSLSLSLKNHCGVDVTVICLYANTGDDYLGKRLVESGIPVIYLNKHRGFDWKNSRLFKNTLKAIKPDVIHFHLNSIMTAFLSSPWHICPCFATIHNTVFEGSYGNRHSLSNVITRRLFKSKKIGPVAISGLVKESIANFFGISDIPTIFNGVDVSQFCHSIPFSKRAIDFAYIGRFVEQKNPLCIIKAYEKAFGHCNSVKLVMLGAGSLLDECRRYIGERRITNVSLKGNVENPAAYLKESRYLVLASRYEGNPIVINEAIASGTYVLATKVGGIPELLINGSGECFDYHEDSLVDDLASRMKALAENNNVSVKLLENFEVNLARVSIDQKADEYFRLFARSVKKR